jgi:hypothetical protein
MQPFHSSIATFLDLEAEVQSRMDHFGCAAPGLQTTIVSFSYDALGSPSHPASFTNNVRGRAIS